MDAWDGDTRRAAHNPETFTGSMHQPMRFFTAKPQRSPRSAKGWKNGTPKPAEQVKGRPGMHNFIENILCDPLLPFATFAALR
jgi:hypothetical protein